MKKKQEIWPWAITGAFVIFIGGLLSGIGIMLKQDVPLVSQDYYVQELAFQDQIDKQNRTLDKGNAPAIVLAENGRGAWLDFSKAHNIGSGDGEVGFYRPSNPDQDFSVPVNPDADGRQYVDLGQAQSGLWQVQVEWEEEGDSYYHETHLVLR